VEKMLERLRALGRGEAFGLYKVCQRINKRLSHGQRVTFGATYQLLPSLLRGVAQNRAHPYAHILRGIGLTQALCGDLADALSAPPPGCAASLHMQLEGRVLARQAAVPTGIRAPSLGAHTNSNLAVYVDPGVWVPSFASVQQIVQVHEGLRGAVVKGAVSLLMMEGGGKCTLRTLTARFSGVHRAHQGAGAGRGMEEEEEESRKLDSAEGVEVEEAGSGEEGYEGGEALAPGTLEHPSDRLRRKLKTKVKAFLEGSLMAACSKAHMMHLSASHAVTNARNTEIMRALELQLGGGRDGGYASAAILAAAIAAGEPARVCTQPEGAAAAAVRHLFVSMAAADVFSAAPVQRAVRKAFRKEQGAAARLCGDLFSDLKALERAVEEATASARSEVDRARAIWDAKSQPRFTVYLGDYAVARPGAKTEAFAARVFHDGVVRGLWDLFGVGEAHTSSNCHERAPPWHPVIRAPEVPLGPAGLQNECVHFEGPCQWFVDLCKSAEDGGPSLTAEGGISFKCPGGVLHTWTQSELSAIVCGGDLGDNIHAAHDRARVAGLFGLPAALCTLAERVRGSGGFTHAQKLQYAAGPGRLDRVVQPSAFERCGHEMLHGSGPAAPPPRATLRRGPGGRLDVCMCPAHRPHGCTVCVHDVKGAMNIALLMRTPPPEPPLFVPWLAAHGAGGGGGGGGGAPGPPPQPTLWEALCWDGVTAMPQLPRSTRFTKCMATDKLLKERSDSQIEFGLTLWS
jgi:hypothetical protein